MQVVKLLVGTLTEVDIPYLLYWTIASLEKHLKRRVSTSTPNNFTRGDSYNHSPRAPLEDNMLSLAQYLYHLDPAATLSVLVRLAEQYPFSSLLLIREFHCGGQISHNNKHFFLCDVGLTSVPEQWVSHAHLTHIKLDHNHLSCVPTGLFQLPALQRLNLSHNCLEAIPEVLCWNVPKLKELDISHNRLVSQPYVILEGRRPKQRNLDANPPSIGKQSRVIAAAQALLSLTGYNLYPCLCSLTKVSINHNPSLNQVGGCFRWVWFSVGCVHLVVLLGVRGFTSTGAPAVTVL